VYPFNPPRKVSASQFAVAEVPALETGGGNIQCYFVNPASEALYSAGQKDYIFGSGVVLMVTEISHVFYARIYVFL
jgi:hypothetical protein